MKTAVNDFRQLVVFGVGGHGREVAWVARRARGQRVEIRFVVDREEFRKEPVHGCQVELISELSPDTDARIIYAIGDGAQRRRIEAQLRNEFRPAILVDPSAVVCDTATLAEGVVIFPRCVVSTDVTIGAHTHLNTGVSVSHDCCLGEFVTISPGAHIAGHVRIGNGVFVGVGASIINGDPGRPLIVGDDAKVAAGACVTTSVAANTIVRGVPARCS